MEMELTKKEELIDSIRRTSVLCWKKEIRKKELDEWLGYFDGSALGKAEYEQCIALILLNNFVYYNISEVRYLCRTLFLDLIHYICNKKGYEKNVDINKISKQIINKTIFLPLGNPSESGANLLYYYRQENDLPKNKFYYDGNIGIEEGIEYIVFVDDVTLSGNQMINYYKNSEESFRNKSVFFTPLIATDDAIENIRRDDKANVTILPAIKLDDRAKCFSEESYIFQDNIKLINDCEKMLRYYHEKFSIKANPFGYEDSQLALSFFYNTPNNTLPIFWYKNQKYSGLFGRKSKINSDKFRGVNFDGKYRYI